MMDTGRLSELNHIAKQMVTPGKGILAADESTGTIEARFNKINLPSTEQNRRAYREMLFTAPGIGDYISGVILFDETIRQGTSPTSPTAGGRTFVSVLQLAGILPGIKVDQGTTGMAASPEEKITTGLEGLAGRLAEYAQLGARFAKWRAVITIAEGLPTPANIAQNAADLAQYALECQQAGLVPIVEPEVLMDGNHTMERCEEVSKQTLRAVFDELRRAGVASEGMILKTNMVIPGKESGGRASPEQVAEATLRVFRSVLPDSLPGQAFLSGGQSEVEATQNLNAMHGMGLLPWQLSYSYGRALQDGALRTWQGKAENVPAAQRVLLHRARMNSLATLGKYSAQTEQGGIERR